MSVRFEFPRAAVVIEAAPDGSLTARIERPGRVEYAVVDDATADALAELAGGTA